MAGRRWTKEEDALLSRIYPRKNKDYILKNIDRTWSSIILRASKFSLRRGYNEKRKSNLKVLLDESLITYYWIGFIMADGHIHGNKRLHIALSTKDKTHLLRFCNYVNYVDKVKERKVGKYSHVKWSCSDFDIVGKIASKFDIKNNKTYLKL